MDCRIASRTQIAPDSGHDTDGITSIGFSVSNALSPVGELLGVKFTRLGKWDLFCRVGWDQVYVNMGNLPADHHDDDPFTLGCRL